MDITGEAVFLGSDPGTPTIARTPMIGERVHYLAHGTPPRADGSQAYPSVCRAAIVTEVSDDGRTGLAVLNPTGMFFHSLAAGGCPHAESERAGGTWHWPDWQ